jgi:two-component system C4-dicarboxylate transport sensor histidine kinase DctB
MTVTIHPRSPQEPPQSSQRALWIWRGLAVFSIALSVLVIWGTSFLLSERFSEGARRRAELRLDLYTRSIVTELQRNAVVPLLLEQDAVLIGALANNNSTAASERLVTLLDEVGAQGFLLLDGEGRTVAATNPAQIGTSHADAPYFLESLQLAGTIFTHHGPEDGPFVFAYARRVAVPGRPDGVVVVFVDLATFERGWVGISDEVLVLDSNGNVVLATNPQRRGRSEEVALADVAVVSGWQGLWSPKSYFENAGPDATLDGDAVLRSDDRLPFRGWRIVGFTSYQTVTDQVNTVLSFEIAALALLLSAGFYVISRRATQRTRLFKRVADDLRVLNARLNHEITERKRAEANLQVAEQTLEQSSKLAALGEMSAAVSHELNQPLAAMKTYLAGARLLMQRERPEEALSSFRRIDDLIERMGTITRQLKSYARRGGDRTGTVDLRTALSSSLSMMEPQLKARDIDVVRTVPAEPVLVIADQLRLEQVLINLFRNAVDATRDVAQPRIDVILAKGETATVSVRDNGHGIADLHTLFEPFYTTKAPGDGVGLGLAIASGIVSEFGGKLTAHNGGDGGAVFELQLPLEGMADVGQGASASDIPPPEASG